MAQYLGLGADFPLEDSEKIVAASLRDLPDEFVVLHHVSWQSRRNGRQGDGEADFLIVHPAWGIIVVEVKGGGVEVVNGRWTSTDRFGQVHDIKNPYEQAVASKHALLRWLQKDHSFSNISLGHVVAFPHLQSVPPLGPIAPEAVTWSREDLRSPSKVVQAAIDHWELRASLTRGELDKLIRLLAPTVHVQRTLGAASSSSSAELLTLTAQQVEALSGLKSARGGLLFGGAGTGKTVLAVARAQQLSREGFRTLLVCYNELLGSALAKQFEASAVYAGTFHRLCSLEAKKAGLSLPREPSRAWWEADAAELLIEACVVNQLEFDAVVVDEAQDFAPGWLEALRCLIGSNAEAPFYVFADPRQELWGRQWASGSEWPFTHQLTKNLRNTSPIAERVSSVFKSGERPSGVAGPPPIWRDLANPKRPEIDVIAVVERFLDEGVGPKSVLVLCESATSANRLRSYTVGAYSFGQWGGNGIAVETVARFKGLESEAVVLLIESAEESAVGKMLAYVGMSRARSLLAVVAPSKTRRHLAWS
ncbi:hypothetical protein ABIF44_004911 [Bradyrhizobium japonicum]|uniref:NERD domain-containing protein n=1 Tax=Bradyrhizobium japonicum TaxID=375 RepID=UPI0009B8E9B2|nr:NERD domain-containing protein/DEAD/DEAH box helicase [Bradyrhizobium japonicum]MYV86688.1 AAA family ATPase [Bradyrhizobium japonicum]